MLILELFGYKVQYPLKQILNSKYKPFKIGGFSSQTNKNFNKYKPLYSAYNFKLAVILTQILVARNPNPTEGMCTVGWFTKNKNGIFLRDTPSFCSFW